MRESFDWPLGKPRHTSDNAAPLGFIKCFFPPQSFTFWWQAAQ